MNAKTHLEKAIALNPEFAEAYYELGMLLKNEAQLRNQLNNFKSLLALITISPKLNVNWV